MSHRTWDMVIDHADQSGVLRQWISSMYNRPAKRQPALILTGDQASGKTALTNALSLLVPTVEYTPNAFNSYLKDQRLCVAIEPSWGISREIREAAMTEQITIHEMMKFPMTITNEVHYIIETNRPIHKRLPGLVLNLSKITDQQPMCEIVAKLKYELDSFKGSISGR